MTARMRNETAKAERHEAILEAARRVFWKTGFQRATMPRIAAEARVAAGTLYLYFPGKEALYAELLIEGYDHLQAALESAVGGRVSASRRAERLIDAFLRFAREHSQYFDIIFYVVQREGRGMKDVLHGEPLARLRAREADCKRLAAEALSGLGGSAHVRAMRVEAVWSMLAGVVYYFRSTDDVEYRAIAAATKQILLRGVSTP